MSNEKYRFCSNTKCKRNSLGIPRSGIWQNCPECSSHVYSQSFLSFRESSSDSIKHLSNKIGRRRMKKGIITLLAGAALATAGNFGYNHLNNYWNSPEYQAAKQLDEDANFVIPQGNNDEQKYRLSNGFYATVQRGKVKEGACGCADKYLITTLDGKVSFVSELFGRYPEGDARILNQLKIRKDGNWIIYDRANIPEYEKWQRVYENTLREVAKSRRQMEENAEKEAFDI